MQRGAVPPRRGSSGEEGSARATGGEGYGAPWRRRGKSAREGKPPEATMAEERAHSEERRRCESEGNPPCALHNFDAVMAEEKTSGKEVCVFLDYDGTLSPIVNDPEKAVMSEEMRQAVNKVSSRFKTSIISGRAVNKVKNFVQIDHLFYAGSHGLDIEGPHPTISHRPPGLDIELVRSARDILSQR